MNDARKTEVEKEQSELIRKIAGFMMVFVTPTLAMTVCIIVMNFMSNSAFEADTIFSLLALFNMLRYPLLLLPSAERTMTGRMF